MSTSMRLGRTSYSIPPPSSSYICYIYKKIAVVSKIINKYHKKNMSKPVGIHNRGNQCYQICVEQSFRSIEKHFSIKIPRKLRSSSLTQYRDVRVQHDAHEFLMHVLDALEKWELYKTFFEGSFTEEIKYSCGHENKKKVPCTVLSVPLYSTLEEMISFLESKDNVESECDVCKTKRDAEKMMYVTSLPKICIFHLVRFDINGVKRNDKVDIPFAWNYLRKNGRYACKAFIVHYGNVRGGHYVSYVCYDNIWYCCNDRNVTQTVDIAKQLSQAYIIFYALENK